MVTSYQADYIGIQIFFLKCRILISEYFTNQLELHDHTFLYCIDLFHNLLTNFFIVLRLLIPQCLQRSLEQYWTLFRNTAAVCSISVLKPIICVDEIQRSYLIISWLVRSFSSKLFLWECVFRLWKFPPHFYDTFCNIYGVLLSVLSTFWVPGLQTYSLKIYQIYSTDFMFISCKSLHIGQCWCTLPFGQWSRYLSLKLIFIN